MAVEAQLCPQCGAAVQFPAGQTEVVCAHCGTPVTRLAAAPAASVEKELEAENLIQQTVALEKKLHAHGQPAMAKIVTAQATDIFRPTLEGRAVLMLFAVEVQPEGEAAFAAQSRALVGLAAVSKYQPGTLLNVYYDPQDHAQVAIDGRRGSDGNTVKTPEQHREDRAKKREAKQQSRSEEPPAQDSAPAAAEPGSVQYWQQLAQQVDQGAPVAAATTPAWGGPRPPGSVVVPVEFDQVTSLGPAAAVHEPQGTRILPNFGTPRPDKLVRYHDGLAYRGHGKEVHTWRWDEVAAILSNTREHVGSHAGLTWSEHEYTLAKSSGEKLILDDGLTDIEPLIQAVKAAVFARVAPPLAQRYQAGEALAFGPVTIQRQNGLQMDGKLYAWGAIQDVKLDDGLLKVTLRTGQKHETRVSAIPNVEILGQIIGVSDVSEFNLKHWGG
jgi:hypothetical protein